MLRLVVAFGDRERQFNIPVNAKGTLGSAGDNDYVVTWPGISGHHAFVERTGKRIIIKDNHSKNGIVVGGRRHGQVTLSPGDHAQLGRAAIRVEEIATSDADLAVFFEHRSSSHGAANEPTESEDEQTRDMAAAMRWVRAASSGILSGDRRRALLTSAAEIARAKTVLIVTDDRDLVVSEIVGALPAAGEMKMIAADGNRAGPPWFCAPLEDGMLLAALPGEGSQFSAWQRDFLDHAGATLFTASEKRLKSLTDGDLLFPETMVFGGSKAMAEVRGCVRDVMQSDLNVLLRGESGTGKELIARTIHASGGATRPFRAVNCAAIPNDLFEAEMFGIGAGVASGVQKRAGYFIEADGGTLFLDEVGDLSQSAQAKLLRVIQEREVVPVGASTPVKVNVRIVASTNRDLEGMIAAGAFRADLYYRLRGIEIVMPPLRDRSEDIAGLAVALAARVARRTSKRIRGVSRRALEQLTAYPWPGNIRELENVIERAVVKCQNGGVLDSNILALPLSAVGEESPTLKSRKASIEDKAIADALSRTAGSKSKAATLLGISRQALHQKLSRKKPSTDK